MCKRFSRSHGRWTALALAALVASLAVGSLASASPAPELMGPLYTETASGSGHPTPAGAGGCAVRIVEIRDTRRAPQTLGNSANIRSIEAPADRDAWLRSIFSVGLAARGFQVSFASPGESPPPAAIDAHVRLQAIWISTQAMNKAASAVFRMTAGPPGGAPGPEHIYRGDESGLNWGGSTSEFNGILNKAFGDALDSMAADLRPLCATQAPGPTSASPSH